LDVNCISNNKNFPQTRIMLIHDGNVDIIFNGQDGIKIEAFQMFYDSKFCSTISWNQRLYICNDICMWINFNDNI
jgi:hypothetical protein